MDQIAQTAKTAVSRRTGFPEPTKNGRFSTHKSRSKKPPYGGLVLSMAIPEQLAIGNRQSTIINRCGIINASPRPGLTGSWVRRG